MYWGDDQVSHLPHRPVSTDQQQMLALIWHLLSTLNNAPAATLGSGLDWK